MAIYFEGWILYSYIILCIVLAVFLKRFYKKSFVYLFFFSIMAVYIFNVIKLTQFPIYIDEYQREAFGGQNVWREMNLIPFKYDFTMASFLNIVMTLPFGFGLPFLIKTSFKRIFIAAILIGLIMEVCQLLSALYAGYTFRYVDINDVIFNFMGTIIGYIIFKVFKMSISILINKLKIQSNALIKYIQNT